jgi:hypothetical protein
MFSFISQVKNWMTARTRMQNLHAGEYHDDSGSCCDI